MKEVSPLIISASRRTDIPAFYMDWFLSEWEKGWTEWVNPFNRNQRKKVLFENTELVVFWSKYPIGILKNIERLNFDFLVLYTVNLYPDLEKRLPKIEKRIELFKELSDILEPSSVIWRFDPIVFYNDLSIDEIIKRFEMISKELEGYTKRVIISVMTPYKKVLSRMKKEGFTVRDPSEDEILHLGRHLKEISSSRGMEIQTCADRFWKIFERAGVKRGRCIDAEYIERVFRDNKRLVEGLKKLKKDRGQRDLCGCVESVDIGKYKTCKFGCTYCYAV